MSPKPFKVMVDARDVIGSYAGRNDLAAAVTKVSCEQGKNIETMKGMNEW